MRMLSWNVNGLRSVYRNGFLSWLKESNADVVCLQEIKLQEDQLPEELLNPVGYHSYFNSADKKGYSGVAIYTRKRPFQIEKILGMTRFDQEGRILKADYSDFSLLNVYLPHGGRQKENLKYKLQAYSMLFKCLNSMQNKKVILLGDFNIAHKEIDLAKPKQNKNNVMFTTEEREQLDKLIELGFVDTFRLFCQESGYYSWFPYGFDAKKRNLGWRIDYAFVSKDLKPRIKNSSILREITGSDHCPILVEIEV